MKKNLVLFVFFFSLLFAFGGNKTTLAAVLGEQCVSTVGSGDVGRQDRVGVCRSNSGNGTFCQPNEDETAISNCVPNSSGVVSRCCTLKVSASVCAGNNGVCVQPSRCTGPVPGNPSCLPSNTEVCCNQNAVRPDTVPSSGVGLAIATNICINNGGSCDSSCWEVTGQQRLGVCTLGGECCTRSDATAAAINRAYVNTNIQDPNLRAQALAAVDRGVRDLTTVFGPNFGNYQLLEQIPGSNETVGRLDSYLRDIYTFAFWAVGIAVVFMLTIGGFMYLTAAGNTSRMESAKTVIFDAILGLVLALVAWLFLYVINPDLVNLNLRAISITPISSRPTAPATPTTTGTPTAPAPSGTVQSLAQQIRAGGSGITLAGSGSCSSAAGTVSPSLTIQQAANGTPVTRCQNGCPGSGQCTQTTSLSSAMLSAMLQVARQYPFTVSSITGGSHTPSSDHYAGRAVDITTSNKADWPAIVIAFRNAGARGQTSCDNNGTLLPSSRCNEANHIHVAF